MPATVCLTPTTPTRSTYSLLQATHSYPPLKSSPLASPASSPAARAEARRRSHYKANPFTTPQNNRHRDAYAHELHRHSSHTPNIFAQGSSVQTAGGTTPTEEPPRKAFLRERLKARCLERASQKRERAIGRGSRHLSSDRSSDGVDEMMAEDDEDEEFMLNDELFRRIVDSAKRKERHAYRLSYAYDVGSSFDPDMEDPQSWESELHESKLCYTEPADLLEEELEAYAAEAELNLDDLQAEDIWSLSDLEDPSPTGEDHDMDTN